tara:strand:+ start:127 stop:1005 length:879 start_codon:yes stop_codon:yes gene_type:complete
VGNYAKGSRAFGFCDRCGFRYNLKELRTETVNLSSTNLRVCPVCWDPDQPQNMLGRIPVDDPQALRDPRPLGAISGRDLPAAYRWDFSTGVEKVDPIRIDGWWASQGSLTYDEVNERVNLVADPSTSGDVNGDPYMQQGFNGALVTPDWLSIDTSKYKYVVAEFVVDRFPLFTNDEGYPDNDFQGALYFGKETDIIQPITSPWNEDKRVDARPLLRDFDMSQASEGFLTADRNMASNFKIVWECSVHSEWTGTVTGLRLDFFQTRNDLVEPFDSGDIAIESIEVVAFHNLDL